MSNAAPTVQAVALQLLRYQGITQLAPQAAGSNLETVALTDLSEVCLCLNAGMQELFKRMPSEGREYPQGFVLHSPTQVVITCTVDSNAIVFVSGWASWMTGCTMVIAGDDQDNEIVNATTMVKPFGGAASGNVAATVYGDAIVMDASMGAVIGPVEIPNQLPLWPCDSRMDFIRKCNWPLIVNEAGQPYPFFNYIRKTVARPRVWFVEGIFNAVSTFTQRRLRFGPMPDIKYQVQVRMVMNPPRFGISDIAVNFSGGNYSDPGTVIPLSDELVESGFLPIALHHYANTPGFKNEELRPGIEKAYELAIAQFNESVGQISLCEGRYV